MTPDVARAILKMLLLFAVLIAAMMALRLITPTFGLLPFILLFVAFFLALKHIVGEPERKRKERQADSERAAGGAPQAPGEAAPPAKPRKPWTTPPIMPSHAVVLTAGAFYATWCLSDLVLRPLGQSEMSFNIGVAIAAVVVYALDQIQEEWQRQQER